MDNVDQRFEELEVKVAYQEDTIQQLNEVIIRQQNEIDRLKTWYQEFNMRLEGLTESLQTKPEDELPPHY